MSFIPAFCDGQIRTCGFLEFGMPVNKLVIDSSIIDISLRNDPINYHECCIPLVFHIIYNTGDPVVTDDFIIDQVHLLNLDFDGKNSDIDKIPAEFTHFKGSFPYKFCLGNSLDNVNHSGIVRVATSKSMMGVSPDLFLTSTGGSSPYFPDRYINIWIADMGENLGGYASKPGNELPDQSGIVINPIYFSDSASPKFGLGRILVHEMGHYLGLDHLWGSDNDCWTDDGIADTPTQEGPHFDCPVYPSYSCGTSDMFMNFMDYVQDDCMIFFTQGQIEKMVLTLANERATLLHSSEICRVDANDCLVHVYPNPVSEYFFVDLSCEIGIERSVRIIISDVLGRVVFVDQYIVPESGIIKIDGVSDFHGLHFLKIFDLNDYHSILVMD